MIPSVARHETNEKNATYLRVSYLFVVIKQIEFARISAHAIAADIRNKFPGSVSK